ncbi:hypothetical protein BDFB_013937 [Asbolus verrucosus]|uniref:Uncharacterized protein n=1 Tax=Asbolus verrucosus TaxID=1661398 RepID=A0A482VHZ9_ASBVE|nr:hypothetical protein BDFB_013937 [Asbolus verrucosus]
MKIPNFLHLMPPVIKRQCENVKPWEELKSEADMEQYIWENNASKVNTEKIFGKEAKKNPQIQIYSEAVDKYMNEGQSEYINNYGEAVRQILNISLTPL